VHIAWAARPLSAGNMAPPPPTCSPAAPALPEPPGLLPSQRRRVRPGRGGPTVAAIALVALASSGLMRAPAGAGSWRSVAPSSASFAAMVDCSSDRARGQAASRNSITWGRRGSATPRPRVPRPALLPSVEAVKRFLHISRFPTIWMEEWVGPANLDRANLRVSGFDTYALIAAVLLQVLIGFYGVISEPEEGASKVKHFLYEAQLLLVAVSVLTSAYTMVSFLLNKIYAVAALAMHKDVAYAVFTAASGRSRIQAFWSLIVSMVTFLAAFSLNIVSKFKGRKMVLLAVAILLGAAQMGWEWTRIMAVAGQIVYNN